MGVIQKLSATLANKIAAGEVVERPASVVKELTENAIDAGSTSVRVDIEEGGLKLIRVTDNGRGIAPEDCKIAFERHATSKIRQDADLFQIRTLGFRGEALPSIAAVSYTELKTSDGKQSGSRLVLQGGHVIQSGHTQSRRGTEITVSHLFYNTPARLKYLKSIHTELGKITDVVNRMALSHPEVRYLLTHDGKPVFQTNGSGDPAHVLAAIYGVRTAKSAIPFSGKSLDFAVSGLAVNPQINRAGRQYVYIFVNDRFIRNYPIFNSILEGYHTLLMVGRYPICMIHIKMDPSLIDVNVHPAKLEARISKEKDLCDLIRRTIRNAFHNERLIPSVDTKERQPRPQSAQQSLDFSPGVAIGPDLSGDGSAEPTEHFSTAPNIFAEQVHENGATDADTADPGISQTAAAEETSALQDESGNDVLNIPEAEKEKPRRMPKLYPIGQMHGTYIFAQNEDGLYIIDQHAAQERINYEYYREKVGENAREVQELLVPMTFEFTDAEYETVMQYHDYLKGIGLDFEPFGARALIVRAHPTWMPKGKEPQMVEDIVQQLIESGKVSIKKLREALAKMMSCKRAIKANHYLRPDEIQALLDHLSRAQDPFTCPHGRPVLVHFTPYEMEKMFKRVQ
jgi:DNA mismatch repair protein MutL